MSLSSCYEVLRRLPFCLLFPYTALFRSDCCSLASTTFRREDLQKGFEPDSCYYFAQASRLTGKRAEDMATDLQPDSDIVVEITRSSLNRCRICAAVGVRESWRYNGERDA